MHRANGLINLLLIVDQAGREAHVVCIQPSYGASPEIVGIVGRMRVQFRNVPTSIQ